MVPDYTKLNSIYIVSCIDIFAVSIFSPLFTQHLKSIGFSNTNIGLISSVYSGVQFLTSPLVGHLSDVYRSKSVLTVFLLVCSLCYPLMGFSISFWSIVFIRTVIGVVKQTQLLCKNYIEETTDEKDHVKSFGQLSGYTSLGFILGPIIGGYMVDYEDGFVYIYCVTGVLFALNSAVAYYLPEIYKIKSKPKQQQLIGNFFVSFKNIPWSLCWDLFLLKCSAVFAMHSFYQNYTLSMMARFKISSVLIGYSYSLQGLVRAMTAFAIHRLLNAFPSNLDILRRIQIVYIILIVSFVALFFTSNIYLYSLFLIPFNVCVCFIRIVNHEALMKRAEGHSKGIMIGAFNNVTSICRFIAPLIVGYIIDVYGVDSVYVISLFSLFVGIAVISSRERRRQVKID